MSGDVHPNSGPSKSPHLSPTLQNSSEMNPLFLTKHMSFVNYNVQSIFNKLDLIRVELSDFDIIAFSETWLNQSISTDDLKFESFSEPERKDRLHDSHGGVLLYVKNNICYKRRCDLEPLGIKCIWI